MFSDEDLAATLEIVSGRRPWNGFEAASNLLPGDVRHRAFYRSAFSTEGLKAYADAIPPEDELEEEQRYPGRRSATSTARLRRQAQLTRCSRSRPGWR